MKASETAVVLIEFQNEFCNPGGKFYDLVKDEIARQGTVVHGTALLKTAREKGCLVIHSPFVFDEAWADEKCVCGIIAGARDGGACRPGDWGTEIIDEMKPGADEIVLDGKRALSAFTNTALGRTLEEKGVRNVVFAGFIANVCVEASARSAYDAGYHVVICRDATGATSTANQDYVEREIYPLIGEVVTVSEFADSIE